MSRGFASPWSAEDGGPARQQRAGDRPPTGTLQATVRRTLMSTMTVLGAPGEVFLLTHSALRANFGLPTTAQVERIDPVTLQTCAASPRLPGGPMWPGGMAVHPNGDLYVVYGRWLHRLDRDCQVKGALELPIKAPWNSFVILDCGLIATKNLSDNVPARLTLVDPDTLTEVAALTLPEASVARLSAVGDTVYVVGVDSIRRVHWHGGALVLEPAWHWAYREGTGNSHGWDAVIAAGSAWFMDNGAHRYRTSMTGAGVAKTPNRLLRISVDDSADHAAVAVSGLPGGSITNPPLVDPDRRIVIAYDSANRMLQAFDLALKSLWQRRDIGCASHMLLFPDSGTIITNDHGRGGEWVVTMDIVTGAERGRVRLGGLMQGVVFPSPGWQDDLYWCGMDKVARVFSQSPL
ncbi:MAG: hypothetical protein ACOYLS_03290 [Polymorphobacter sp.]